MIAWLSWLAVALELLPVRSMGQEHSNSIASNAEYIDKFGENLLQLFNPSEHLSFKAGGILCVILECVIESPYDSKFR